MSYAQEELSRVRQEYSARLGWEHLCSRQEKTLATFYGEPKFPWGLTHWYGGFGDSALTLTGQENPFPEGSFVTGRIEGYLLHFLKGEDNARYLFPFPDSTENNLTTNRITVARAYSALARLASFRPQQYGLEWNLMSDRDERSWAGDRIAQAFADGKTAGNRKADGYGKSWTIPSTPRQNPEEPYIGRLGTIHPVWLTGCYGWMLPEAVESEEFASPYLAPILGFPRSTIAPHPQQWGMFLRGLPEPLYTTAWDNVEGHKRLVEHLSVGDEGTRLIQYGLTFGLEDIDYSRRKFNTIRGLA